MKTEPCYAWPRGVQDEIHCCDDIFYDCLRLFYVANLQKICAVAVSIWFSRISIIPLSNYSLL